MSDFASILASAKMPERTVPLCLRGDLVAEVQELETELDAHVSVTMADSKARDLAQRIEALRAEMQSSTYSFRLRGRNRAEWALVIAENPPRPGNDTDAAYGYNFDAFFPALVRACLVDPELTAEAFDELVGKLSDGQFTELSDAAVAVSRRKVDIPFSPAASATLRSSGDSSQQPDS